MRPIHKRPSVHAPVGRRLRLGDVLQAVLPLEEGKAHGMLPGDR